MAAPHVLALDIGTSSVRASLYDATLTAQRTIQIRYRWRESAHWVELPPPRLRGHIEEAIDQLLSRRTPPIAAVGIAAFWHSLMGLDAAGRPITPLLPWSDRRAAAEAVALQEELSERAVHRRTGCRLHMSYWPARLRWFQIHQRKTFARVARWVSFTDWLEQQWLGRDGTSISQASGTGLLVQDTCQWDTRMLEASGIDARQLPPLLPPEADGELRAAYRQRWPALARARWVPAAADGALNNVGAGCVRRHRAAVMIGTSAAMRVLWTPRPAERLAVPPGLWRYRLDARRVLVGGALSNGGNSREWVLRMAAGRQDDPRVNRAGQDALQRLADALTPDVHGLTVLPYLAGERSPHYHVDARGTLHGLTLDTRPEHLLRAMMEAVAYRLAAVAGELRSVQRVNRIVAAGGGLERSETWTQILADTLARPVLLCADSELTSRGAAALALEQLGILRLENVQPPAGREVRPDQRRTRIYRAAAARQEGLRRSLVSGGKSL